MSERESLIEAREMRKLAHQAVTEGVNLKYVERMRQALYAAAERIESLEGGDAECTCPNRDTIVGNCPIHGDRMRLSSSRAATSRPESWRLVERYVERYPHDWRLVFKRDEMTLEVSVPEEVWRAFDGI